MTRLGEPVSKVSSQESTPATIYDIDLVIET